MNLLITAAVLLAPPAPMPVTVKTDAELADHLHTVVNDSKAAAKDGLATLEELVTDENCKSMGFDTKADAKAGELGVPFPVVLVRLDELKEYKKGDDPLRLLHPIHRAVYPVLVKGEPRSGMEVHEKDGKWTATSFGLATEVQRYAEVRKKHAGDDEKTVYFLVRIPSLHEYDLGHRTDQGIKLIRTRPPTQGKADKLEARPAADVLLDLVPFAKAHDGKPR